MEKPKTLYDWANMSSHSILNDVDSEGKRLLALFLKDYTDDTGETVNASCPNCLNTYIKNFKNKYSMESKNTSDFTLRKEYQNIPLTFGSPILVNNNNITNEYGRTLAERFLKLGTKPQVIFLKFPDELKTDDTDGLEIVNDSKKVVKEEKPAKPAPVKSEKVIAPVIAEEQVKEENVINADDLANALNIEVIEPVVETGNDTVLDLETE